MKRLNLLSMALVAVLMVFAVGCTTLQESAGGYEDAPGRRVYRQMPYAGNQVIVLERDPFTGQYYQVSPYGYYGGAPFNTFGYGYPAYGYPNGGGAIIHQGGGGGRVSNQPAPRPQQQPAQRGSETTNRAKDIIRGN